MSPRLYIGGALAANAAHTLRELGITHVLNCTDDLPDAHEDAGFVFGRVKAKDVTAEDLSLHFAAASDFISSAMLAPDASVLVHCFEGKSRSATIVAQYVMETTKTSLRDVLAGYGALRFFHFVSKVFFFTRLHRGEGVTEVNDARSFNLVGHADELYELRDKITRLKAPVPYELYELRDKIT